LDVTILTELSDLPGSHSQPEKPLCFVLGGMAAQVAKKVVAEIVEFGADSYLGMTLVVP